MHGPRDNWPEGRNGDLGDLSRLDAKSLTRRWRSLVGGAVPAGLGRTLILRVLAYHLQARRYGDLDRVSRETLKDLLARPVKREKDGSEVHKGGVWDAWHAQLRPGTILGRDHAGTLHRVMVMEQGFTWNGRTYDSLSKVAFAITGTRWNGPRFFGLRGRSDAAKARGGRPTGNKAASSSTRSGVPPGPPSALPHAALP